MKRKTRPYQERCAEVFQRYRRAQFGVKEGTEIVFSQRERDVTEVQVPLGFCACVTCGIVKPWGGRGCITAGHFISRIYRPTLLLHKNVHPQCARCNRQAGRVIEYEVYLEAAYDEYTAEALRVYALHGDPIVGHGDDQANPADYIRAYRKLTEKLVSQMGVN